jgi:hypothetical protein
MKALNISQIVIFGLLTPPATYCLFKHGKSGLLGWLFVVSFCFIRTLGAILQYRDEQNNTVTLSAQIVSNLGITPLLLATAGLLHESRWNFSPSLQAAAARKPISFMKWIFIFQFHTLISVGIILILTHATDLNDVLTTGQLPSGDDSKYTQVKIGFGILVLGWTVLTLWTLVSWRSIPTMVSDKTLQTHGNEGFFIEGDVVYFQVSILL